ncbi:hypothetical protein [Pseudonocardia sp. WMMC193]|uniref:hypothetical protein n=1 Tax=Pseudonocardia sp. WMMC193 TaxID=2911965 RepID=UPI001F481B38|nr:hypothetical protein [Pseudonocardia sp. WMMC193]MCF7553835.1 hypothetical protein [Pseudonocardia sp. WMMC193]
MPGATGSVVPVPGRVVGFSPGSVTDAGSSSSWVPGEGVVSPMVGGTVDCPVVPDDAEPVDVDPGVEGAATLPLEVPEDVTVVGAELAPPDDVTAPEPSGDDTDPEETAPEDTAPDETEPEETAPELTDPDVAPPVAPPMTEVGTPSASMAVVPEGASQLAVHSGAEFRRSNA